MIIDQHQPVVEKYYGPGRMHSVLERLLDECDRVVKSTLDGWREERHVQRKVATSFRRFLSLAISPVLSYQILQVLRLR